MDHHENIVVRIAEERDAEGMREVFLEVYGGHYSYPHFFEVSFLKRMIFGVDAEVFVAVEKGTGRIVGTASVLLEIGAFSDLLGEFGRLVVVPGSRQHGIGSMLMEARLAAVRDRLHVGIVDARCAHPFSLKIAQHHGFRVVGFSPLRHRFIERESNCMMAQWFGEGLSLRRNNPRIIPEVQGLAALALENAGLPVDVIIDDKMPPYPHDTDFVLEEMSTEAYPRLLRIERGRVRHREVFGPMRLHYGFFKLRRGHAEYLIARDGKRIAGALGFIRDEIDRVVRVFELITPRDRAVHFLLAELERMCRQQWDVALIEIDVRATAPRLQRTLVALGFIPASYIPAMVFHEVERLDVVRMVRLLVPPELGPLDLTPEAREMCDLVMRPILTGQATPAIRAGLAMMGINRTLTEEQICLLAGSCSFRRFDAGEHLFVRGAPVEEVFFVLDGEVAVCVAGRDKPVGVVGPGETLGEMGLLRHGAHSATATARTPVEALVIARDQLERLMHTRPDIGLSVHHRLALDLAHKLERANKGLG